MQQIGPFKSSADRDKITISREDSKITVAPSDTHGLAKLVSLAMSYCVGKVLPPQLQWGSFEFRFSEEGNHVLGRIDVDGGLIVTQNDGDDLIRLLSASLNSHVDAVRLTSGPRRGASRGSPDPVIVGRE
jgi:hypothetical protein